MRGLGRVKVLRKPLDLMKKVLASRPRRQRSQEHTQAVAAVELTAAEMSVPELTAAEIALLLAPLGAGARRHAVEAEPEGTTTTTVLRTAPSKSSFTMHSSALPSRSAAAKPTDGAEAADPPEPCPICQDPVGLANPEGVVEAWTSLHCGHRFGTVCIRTWLQNTLDRDQNSTPSCPICRATAKHPDCGHAVCPPSPHSRIWAQYQMRLQVAQNQERERLASGRPQRRRLQRRSGHPQIPTPPRRLAERVGNCSICTADEARLKDSPSAIAAAHRKTRPQVAGTASATQRIKSYLPVQVRVQTTTASDSAPNSPGLDQEARGSRVPIVSCDTQGPVATPVHEPTRASQRRESV